MIVIMITLGFIFMLFLSMSIVFLVPMFVRRLRLS